MWGVCEVQRVLYKPYFYAVRTVHVVYAPVSFGNQSWLDDA